MARLRRITRDALPHQYRSITRADVYLCAACQPLAERWLQERLQAHGTRPAWRKFGPRERSWSKRSKT